MQQQQAPLAAAPPLHSRRTSELSQPARPRSWLGYAVRGDGDGDDLAALVRAADEEVARACVEQQAASSRLAREVRIQCPCGMRKGARPIQVRGLHLEFGDTVSDTQSHAVLASACCPHTTMQSFGGFYICQESQCSRYALRALGCSPHALFPGTFVQEAALSRGLAGITLRPKPPEWLAVKTGTRPERRSSLQSKQADEDLMVRPTCIDPLHDCLSVSQSETWRPRHATVPNETMRRAVSFQCLPCCDL